MPLFNSSAIKEATYDHSNMRLRLRFPEGHYYDFCRVPAHVYDGLVNAVSKGRYYNAHIRDRYQC